MADEAFEVLWPRLAAILTPVVLVAWLGALAAQNASLTTGGLAGTVGPAALGAIALIGSAMLLTVFSLFQPELRQWVCMRPTIGIVRHRLVFFRDTGRYWVIMTIRNYGERTADGLRVRVTLRLPRWSRPRGRWFPPMVRGPYEGIGSEPGEEPRRVTVGPDCEADVRDEILHERRLSLPISVTAEFDVNGRALATQTFVISDVLETTFLASKAEAEATMREMDEKIRKALAEIRAAKTGASGGL